MDRANADLLFKLHQQGKSIKEISRELDCSIRSVARYLDFIKFHGFDDFVDFYVNENKPQFNEEVLAKYADQVVKDKLSFDRACIFFKISQCKRLQELIDQRRPRISPKEKARQRAEAKEKLKGFDMSKLLFICDKDLHPFITNGIIFGSSDNETTRAMIAARYKLKKIKIHPPISRSMASTVDYTKKSELNPDEIAIEKSMRIKCPPEEPGVLFVTSVYKFSAGVRDLYLSCVVDCFNLEIVGYSLSTVESIEAILLSIKQALPRFNIEAGPILHSAKKPLYEHSDFKDFLKAEGIQQSLSYTGNYYNATNKLIDTAFGHIKSKMAPDQDHPSVEAIAVNLVYNIDYYNGRCPQTKLNGKPPIEYREDFALKKAGDH